MEIFCFDFLGCNDESQRGWKISAIAYFCGYHLISFSSYIVFIIKLIFLI